MTKESIRIRGRKTAIKQPKTNIFIGCEGFETEPNYFNEIKNLINKDLVEVKIVGFGQGIHGALIKCKRVIENNPSYRFITWDHIWIVCDKDKTSDETFNDYILQPPTIAGLTVEMAWSNPSFELWYLLHFTDINLPTNRERYATSLSGFLGSKEAYNKSRYDLRALILANGGSEEAAITRARALLRRHDHHPKPANQNPCTMVFALVEQLRAFLE